MSIPLSFIFLLFSCKDAPIPADPPSVIVLDWQEGQVFHLAAARRELANMTEESPVSLEDYSSTAALIDTWSEEVIWSYRVIEDKLIPTDERLIEFATSAAGHLVELTIIKSFVDPTLNQGANILELNPVTYLIFRSDNNRLVSTIQFTTVDGDLRQEFYYIKHGNHSSSVLSQSNIVLTPTYLAPFGARWYTTTLPTETGNYVYSDWIGSYLVDVTYSDEMGGEIFTSRYQRGFPWPIETISENFRSRLLSEDELYAIRGDIPPQEPADLNFRASLTNANAIDMSETIRIDPEWVDYLDDGWSIQTEAGVEAPEVQEIWEVEFEDYPWAGNWWSLRTGELVFGHGGAPTFSGQIKERIDFEKNILDRLSADIRQLQKEPQTASVQEDLQRKHEAYTDGQKVIADELVDFYDQIKADLDSGRTQIQDGYLLDVQGQDYEINALSPFDKMALMEYLEHANYHNPFYLSGWEILNAYNPNGEAWWGHTNGCAAAAILTNQPTDSINFSAAGQDIRFHTTDIKGLLTAAHTSTHSYLYGERFSKDGDDERDLDPESFHKIMQHYLKQRQKPFVVDIEKRNAVWNHPIREVQLKVKFIKQNVVEGSINVTTTTVADMVVLGIPEDYARDIIAYRERVGIIESIDEFQHLEHYDEAYNMFFRTENRRITFQIRVKALLSNCQNIDIMNPEDVDNQGYLWMHWRYFLTVNEDGIIIAGEWKHPFALMSELDLYPELHEEVVHPDFAWFPYQNPRGPSRYGAENPYLNYASLLYFFGEGVKR